MRTCAGLVGLFMVGILLAYQCVFFYQTGSAMSANPPLEVWGWSISLFGAGCLAVVGFEAISYWLGREFIRARQYDYAVIAFLVLLGAMVYSTRIEMEGQIGGVADKQAERAVVRQTTVGKLAELEALRKQQSAWAAQIESRKLGPKTLEQINANIDGITKRIAAIERSLEGTAIVSEGQAVAKFLSRQLGGDEQTWADRLFLGTLIFFGLMRAFALSLIIGCFQMIRMRPEPQRQAAQPDAPPAAKEFVPEPSEPVSEPITVQEEADTAQVREGNIIPYPAKNLPVLESGSDVVEYAVNLMPADGFKMDELMAEIREICGKHDLPTPDPRSVGVALSRLGYESLRPRLYQKKDGGGLAQVRAA